MNPTRLNCGFAMPFLASRPSQSTRAFCDSTLYTLYRTYCRSGSRYHRPMAFPQEYVQREKMGLEQQIANQM